MIELNYSSFDKTINPIDSKQASINVVKISGELDYSNINQVAQEIDNFFSKIFDGSVMIFHFSELQYMNSQSIGQLIQWHQQLTARNITVIVAEPRPNIEDMMNTTGIAQLFQSFSSLDEAKLFASNLVQGDHKKMETETSTPIAESMVEPIKTPTPITTPEAVKQPEIPAPTQNEPITTVMPTDAADALAKARAEVKEKEENDDSSGDMPMVSGV